MILIDDYLNIFHKKISFIEKVYPFYCIKRSDVILTQYFNILYECFPKAMNANVRLYTYVCTCLLVHTILHVCTV